MEFSIENGQLVRDDSVAPTIKVPDNFFTKEFLVAMFNTSPELEGSARELCARLTSSEREKLKQFCTEHGLSTAYNDAAGKWASVGSISGRWRREQMSIIYRARVNTFRIDEILVDVLGRKFTVQDKPTAAFEQLMLTWAEFQYRYGDSVEASLYQHIGCVTRTLEMVLSDLDSRVISADLDLVNLVTKERKSFLCYGLSNVEVQRWELPSGWILAH